MSVILARSKSLEFRSLLFFSSIFFLLVTTAYVHVMAYV